MPSKPISPRRRLANRRNAERATGPRSEAGKRIASQNAVRHRLSVPLPGDILGPLRAEVAALLMQSDVPAEAAEDLAEKIIEFERNMAALRQAEADRLAGRAGPSRAVLTAGGFGSSPPVSDEIGALVKNANASGAQVFTDPDDRDLLKFAGQLLRLDARRQRNATLAFERYLRRARNQLIKALRRIEE